jgi:hypothetical protein
VNPFDRTELTVDTLLQFTYFEVISKLGSDLGCRLRWECEWSFLL